MKIPRSLKITLSILLALIVLAVSGLAMLQHNLKRGREETAISRLRQIHQIQIQFKREHGRYGTQSELEEAGLIGPRNAPTSHYHYWVSDVTPVTFCVHADRPARKIGNHDFTLCEDGVLHSQRSEIPGSVARGQGDVEQR